MPALKFLELLNCYQKCEDVQINFRLKNKIKNSNIFNENEIYWTRGEKELFWNIIKTHIDKLLESKDFNTLESTEIDYNDLDLDNPDDYCMCRSVIRKKLWLGEYHEAVVNYMICNELFFVHRKLSSKERLEDLQSIFLNA